MEPEIHISESLSEGTLSEIEFSEGKTWNTLYVQRMLFTHEIIFREPWIDGKIHFSIPNNLAHPVIFFVAHYIVSILLS